MHPKMDHGPGAYVFAHLFGVSVSVCAPEWWTGAEVEAFALAEIPPPNDAVWRAVDKSTLGLGTATPNPCNIEPTDRKHWFLLIE